MLIRLTYLSFEVYSVAFLCICCIIDMLLAGMLLITVVR